MNLPNQRLLCISDSHQNIAWVKAVIEHEKGNYDHIVTMGDEFDSFLEPPQVASVEETARFMVEMQEGVYGSATQLLGNHTISYAEATWYTRSCHTPKNLHHYCSGYTNSKAKKIDGIMLPGHFEKLQLFVYVNGWLISHAGFRGIDWFPFMGLEDNLDGLDGEFAKEYEFIRFRQRAGLFAVGLSRGGDAGKGGPLWQDFNQEFEDDVPVKQLCGHTPQGFCRATSVGKSYCIDGSQTTYALISPDGGLTIKALVPSKVVSGLWYEEKVDVKPRKER